MTKQTTCKLRINEDVVFTQVEEDIVMMAPSDSEFHGLNKVGAWLWNLLSEAPMSIDELSIHLQEKYAIDATRATDDVNLFVNDMLAKNFLQMG